MAMNEPMDGGIESDLVELVRWHETSSKRYASLLRWYRTVGYARHDGVGVDMHEPPAISGADIEYIDGAGWIDGREMTDDEARGVRVLLEQMAQSARDALAGCSTIVVAVRNR